MARSVILLGERTFLIEYMALSQLGTKKSGLLLCHYLLRSQRTDNDSPAHSASGKQGTGCRLVIQKAADTRRDRNGLGSPTLFPHCTPSISFLFTFQWQKKEFLKLIHSVWVYKPGYPVRSLEVTENAGVCSSLPEFLFTMMSATGHESHQSLPRVLITEALGTCCGLL